VGSRRGDGDIAFNERWTTPSYWGRCGSATLNLFAAALYHMTEQHLIDLVREFTTTTNGTTADR